MPRFTKGFQLPHGHSTPKSSSVLHRNLHLNIGPPWMMTNKKHVCLSSVDVAASSSASPQPGPGRAGMQAVVLAGVWRWASSWEVPVLQQLQWENCMEAVVQSAAWLFRCSLLCFPGLTQFQGYNTKIDGLSISKEIMLLIVPSFCLLSAGEEGGKRKKHLQNTLLLL